MPDWEKIMDESIQNFINTVIIPFLTHEYVLSTLAILIAGAIISFIARRVFYGYFRFSGDSKRKAKKKSNLLNDFISLIDSFRNK